MSYGIELCDSSGSGRRIGSGRAETHRHWRSRTYRRQSQGTWKACQFLFGDWLSEEAKLEIVAHEDRVDAITRAIMEAAHTGDPGDGIVTVLPVSSFHRIRTRSEALPEDA